MVIPVPIGDNLKQKRIPWVVLALISTCVALFVLGRYFHTPAAGWLAKYGGLRPRDFLHLWQAVGETPLLLVQEPLYCFRKGILPVFGHLFLHAHEIHLLGNMLFLWVFGWGLEGRLGRLRFFLFYILCGLTAMALHVALEPGQNLPMVGASGAIAGVLGGYLFSYPFSRIRVALWLVFVFFAEVPAIVFILVWFGYQVVNAQDTLFCLADCKAIAYFAHVGGFVGGALLIWGFRPKKGDKRKTPQVPSGKRK